MAVWGSRIPSVTFRQKDGRSYNTLDDWYLVPTKNVNLALPKQKVQTVAIPGRDGVIDISNSLKIGGGPLFENREGSFEFTFLDCNATYRNQLSLREIIRVVHGQFLYVRTTDYDSGEEFYGRCEVESYDHPSDGSLPTITINYSLEPNPNNGG